MSDYTEETKEESLVLVDSWSETIAKSDLGDVLANIVEVGLDAITENQIIKDIPIISTFISIYKIGNTLKERAYIKKLSVFLSEISKGNVDEKKRKKYLGRITKNKRTTQQELEYVLILLDRIISDQKAKLLAKLFLSYIMEDISWAIFCQLSEAIDRFFPGDAECLHDSVLKNSSRSDIENCALQRLEGLGIVKTHAMPSSFDIKGNVLSTKHDGTYELTVLGKVLNGIIFQKENDSFEVCRDDDKT